MNNKMRPVILNKEVVSKYKNIIFIFITIAIFSIFYVYSFNRTKTEINNFLIKKNPKYEIFFKKIKVSGFFSINIEIDDFELKILQKNGKTILKTKTLNLKKLLFGNIINIYLNDEIYFLNKENDIDYQFSISKNSILEIILEKNNKLSNHNIKIPELLLTKKQNVKENITIKNLTSLYYKVITEDIENSVLNFNADSIVYNYTKDEKSGEFNSYEINVELVISMLSELDSEKKNKIIQNINIEKAILNDITNNFAFSFYGNIKKNNILKQAMINSELKLINYNSIIKTINDKDKYFIFDKDKLSFLAELYNVLPTNSKNDLYNKYYTIYLNNVNKKATINGVNIDNIVKSILFK